ncbi:chromate efflux transporter [Methylosinus sp. KRF6]|uniref:chromate efflux transporter n=1 Tax=Methylosinus sp. KRF6 TaxID=2846853 RepID=UPI001C0DFC68|nr:chromate efflux transporter [Methylosinus sp. KRF6]MBU3887980.1 chromate efflux transporter [Methylosinus sp. KRF6]
MCAGIAATHSTERGSFLEVLGIFLRLGVTSFGGPIAHLGYFRTEFVERRKWLDEAAYTDIIALCQFLPGPASSQAGIILGMLRAGFVGGLAAWVGFTMPSALALIAFAYGVGRLGDLSHVAWLLGLKIVAVAVVAQAVWGMARNLCPDRERATIAVAAALLTLAVPSASGQIGAIVAGGVIGWLFLSSGADGAATPLAIPVGRGVAITSLTLFFALLFGLPVLAEATADHTVELMSSFYRSGSLVFGGGHVVLPLLQQAVVPRGWIDNDAFLAGYGAAQAVPGPLFTFAAYLGVAMKAAPNGWTGGLICLAAIYLPSYLLLLGALPFWDALRHRSGVRTALRGVNATVVGILLGALYTPVWTSAIFAPADFGLGVLAFLLLVFWRTPPWLVVVLGALGATAVTTHA